MQREPREKLELFPTLGYYFVSFRAMESERSRDKAMAQRASDSDDEEGAPYQDADVVQGVNMYLVVFREGICSVRFFVFCSVCLLMSLRSFTMRI